MMNILLDDGLQGGVGTGIDSYSRSLTASLAALPDTAVTGENFAPSGGRGRSRLAYLRYIDSAAYRRKAATFDVIHYTNYAIPKKLPENVVCAVTVHDLTAFKHPETLPAAYALYNRCMIRRAMKRADLIFAVSDTVKAEIAQMFPRAANRTVRVYPGHYQDATAAESPPIYENKVLNGLKKHKFFLFIGTLEKRKNLTQLLNAYLLLLRTYPTADYSLVLAGKMGFGSEELCRLVKQAPRGADIRLPGYIGNSDRQKLYKEAAAFVFPSIYEGFGSPQTECMACRLPLLASDIPTNREISGNYATYFPLDDVATLTNLMRDVTKGTISVNADIAAEKLSLLTWQSAAAETRAAYKAALQRKKSK